MAFSQKKIPNVEGVDYGFNYKGFYEDIRKDNLKSLENLRGMGSFGSIEKKPRDHSNSNSR